MNPTPVTIVVPTLGDRSLLAACLDALEAALRPRAGIDEVLVVDDTGRGELRAWLAERFCGARVVESDRNVGFARALQLGVEAARSEVVLALNSDVRARAGFLEPMLETLAGPDVFAVVPRILRDGRPGAVESWVAIEYRDGEARVRQPMLEGADRPEPEGIRPVPFPIAGACLFRVADFRELGGLDALFEPFYLEDVDLGWRAWRAGKRVLLDPRAEVEHVNQATIGAVASEATRRAAIARNGYLLQWKHLSAPELADHAAALDARALDARARDDREALVHLALAFESLDAALAARVQDGASFEELARATDPFA